MADENYLIDAQTGDERFRVLELVAAGRSYQIVRVEDTAEGGVAAAKAVLYDNDRADDAAYREGRRQALEDEWRILNEVDHPLLPEPVALFRATSEEAGFDDEPVLVYQWRDAETLFERVRREHPEGLEPDKALGILDDLVQFLTTVHAEGFVYRDLDPRHLLVDDDLRLVGVVGVGNVIEKGGRPNEHKMDYEKAAYVAPEVRGERSGKLLRPTADAYAVGALMSFVLTGEEPRTVVENPLNWTAYDRLSNLEPPGLALLVARLIQPHFKKRIGRMERLAKYTTAEGLPTAQTDGFGMLLLPAPFSGVEDPENNRALKSKLSSGPLISVDRRQASAEDAEPAVPEVADMPRSWAIAATLIALGVVAALWAVGII